MTDARILRTRAALHHSVISLSSEKQIVDITVSELAEHAGINRVTFYKHYNTPAEALADALAAKLREDARSAGTEEVLANRESIEQALFLVLDHIEAYRRLYEIAFTDQVDGTMPLMLARHLSETFDVYLTKRRKKKPSVPDVDLDVAAAYLSNAATGAISVWLLEGDMSRERFQENLWRLLPEWFFPEETDSEA